MSTKQELIDYMTNENVETNMLISQKTQQKLEIDGAIAQQQANIDYFNDQKTQTEAAIVAYTTAITDLNAIIAILETP